jgi:hypothetical protein
MFSMTYGKPSACRFLRCVQFVSTLGIEHHGFDSRSLVSLSGSNITRGRLDLRMAHERRDSEGVIPGLA